MAVNGDEETERDERFLLDLTQLEAGAYDVIFSDASAFGSIEEDDGEVPLFADGFESGDLGAWSDDQP